MRGIFHGSVYFFISIIVVSGQNAGDIVITEIMPDPAAVSDNSGEYIELYNHTNSVFDLEGFFIEDNSDNSHEIGSSLTISAESFIVLANSSDPLGDGSLTPDYVISGVGFNNSDEDIYLKNESSTTIAQISYTSSTTGVSHEVKYVAAGTDGVISSSDLIDATNIISNSDKGSPGIAGNTITDPDVNLSPTSGDLIISEFMPDPDDVSDANGEFFEIFNNTASTIALDDCTIEHLIGTDFAFDFLTTIASGQFFVVGRNGNSNTNGGIPVDYVGGFSLTNTSDEIILKSSTAVEIDRVEYTTAFGFEAGVSAVFIGNVGDDNNSSANWQGSTTRENYSNPNGDETDLGSPGIKGNDAPLPVQLTSFTASYNEDNHAIELNWETATETNNAGFEVHRSSIDDQFNEGEFEVLDFVHGNGTVNSPRNYEYTDTDFPNAENLWYRLKQIDNDGAFAYSKVRSVELSAVTSVDDDELNYEFSLAQNYPNPFNPTTTIKYTIPTVETGHIRSLRTKLIVYDILGQQIKALVNEVKSPGNYEVVFNASQLHSGVYFYTLNYGEFTQTRKLLLIK